MPGADDQKADLHRYLQRGREAMLWKLDGLSEYDVRRPLVPTGTNLLGLVKHLTMVDAGYFGDTFGRPFPEPLTAWDGSADFNADMYAAADESRQQIVDRYQRVWAHSDATIEALPLDAVGQVPWWPSDRAEVTLHRVLVHMIAETERHAGHADIVRELIDGAAGVRADNDNLADGDTDQWVKYHDHLEQVAREAAGRGRFAGMADDTLRTVTLHRTGLGQFEVRNARGGTMTIGVGGSADFTPVELLLAAIGGCTGADVDYITSKRAEPESFVVQVTGDKVKDESGGNRLVNLAVELQVTFPDGAGGDAARAVLPRAAQMSHDRLCTVSRTVELGTAIDTRTEPPAL